MKYTILCRAKVNLVLKVLNKRPDNYHNIWTIFQAVDYGDTLSAQTGQDIRLFGANKITESPEDNLIIKAAKELKKAFSITQGIHFNLSKRLPLGAGLGGGSSDAAGALLLCNKIWHLSLGSDTLTSIARNIGADVPFFLKNGTQIGTGIGESLQQAPKPYDFHVLILTPKSHVNTAKAYQSINTDPNWDFNGFLNAYKKSCTSLLFYKNLENDFESPVYANFPKINELKEAIMSFNPIKALLSGSGSSIFSLWDNKAYAEICQKELNYLCRFSILTRFTSNSPDISILNPEKH